MNYSVEITFSPGAKAYHYAGSWLYVHNLIRKIWSDPRNAGNLQNILIEVFGEDGNFVPLTQLRLPADIPFKGYRHAGYLLQWKGCNASEASVWASDVHACERISNLPLGEYTIRPIQEWELRFVELHDFTGTEKTCGVCKYCDPVGEERPWWVEAGYMFDPEEPCPCCAGLYPEPSEREEEPDFGCAVAPV